MNESMFEVTTKILFLFIGGVLFLSGIWIFSNCLISAQTNQLPFTKQPSGMSAICHTNQGQPIWCTSADQTGEVMNVFWGILSIPLVVPFIAFQFLSAVFAVDFFRIVFTFLGAPFFSYYPIMHITSTILELIF